MSEGCDSVRAALLLGIVLVVGVGADATRAQSPFYGEADSLLLHRIYESDDPVLATWTEAAHRSAHPVFWGAVPAAAIGTHLAGGSVWEGSYELALAEASAYLLQAALKQIVRRPRPYLVYDRIESRSHRLGAEDPDFSMPSGHAVGAFAISTSWWLRHRHWGVAVPLGVWAGGVTVSRPRLGVHHPSDVLVGALLGIGLGLAVHHAGPHLVPRFAR